MAYFDEDGNEVEGLMTQEDLDTKLGEQKTAHETATAEATEASNERIIALEADKTTAAAALAAAECEGGGGEGGDKEDNVVALREKLEATNTALDEFKATNKAESDSKIDVAIKAAADGDEALAEKIKHNYDTMLSGVKADTSEQIAQKVASAARLSVDATEVPNPLDIARAGGSRGAAPVVKQDGGKPMSASAKEVGGKLGISDADREKYGNDPRLNKKA